MAIKLTWYFIISITVFFSKCSAVIVIVDDIVSVAEGNETRIMCNMTRSSSSSVGIPTVTWYNVTNGVSDTIAQSQGGVGLVRSSYIDRFSVDGDTTLVIANTSRSDNGTYQCSVSIFDDPPSPASDDFILSVVYLDDVVININSNTSAENVTITCSANGSPPPIIILIKDDDVIKTENNAVLTYEIDNVTQSDRGSYKCTASDSVGSKHSRTIVLNYFKPEVTLDKEVTIAPGGSKTITARVSANPNDITYKWTIDPENNDIIISNDDVTDTDPFSSTITIMASESAEDSTEYTVTVEVTNNIGSATQQANINVNDPCADKPCQNGATCLVVGGGYNCSCTKDFSGLNCSKLTTTFVPTTPDCGCENGGTCADGKCICPKGFKGPKCEEKDTNVIVIMFATLGGCVVLVGISFGGHHVYKSKNSKKPSNDPTSDPVVPQGDVEMKQPDSNSDLKRYAASGGHLYTQVSFEDKKKKPDSDNGSNKPTAVDTYMDYVPAGNENRIYQDLQHREEETAYVNAMPRKK
ncbi:Down syndrome cell adhesion molecule-like protein 1 homolog isoform X5 [Anneissia japonica]|uniref:Down syndrome cell adhesion molecule-like protein 1 homolog isoform X5 n=1 Tax=Anneissia japonica TaxID=1529436 RepID=UPI001425AEEE|nr:Down syndrome cell adhesion molecule-like protein 1 homolog isoform X5 [Anneissia japonica]